MVSLKALKRRGVSTETLKAAFTSDKPSDAVLKLKNRIRSRIQDGLYNNFSRFKLYHAIDEACKINFRQTTATLVRALAEQPPNSPAVLDAAKQFKLDHLLVDEYDPKTNKPTGKKRLSQPTFFNVLVPLVPAYVKIRAAKITNDRNQTPYFKYEPLINTPLNRARCELFTNRTQTMTTQMGYVDTGREAIQKSLRYSSQFMFIQEEWYREIQEDDDGTKYVDKEGLRYALPHPSRTFIDIAHPPSSLHSDTGCGFGGYWKVRRYRDILNNKDYWNIDRIRLPVVDYRKENITFFNTVYSSCTLQFPRASDKWDSLGIDREDKLQNSFYTSDWEDSAAIVTEYFEKLVPSENGLGDYEYPVWFRFVVANDDTILYANALPDIPIIFWGYDPDDAASETPSLALEVMPFQDIVSNLLTQTILSVKQNLANITFIDTDICQEEDLGKVENKGELFFRGLNFIRYSWKKLSKLINRDAASIRDAVTSVRFPQLDTTGTLATIRAVLDILERVLVMSAQEVAGQASHEQSAEESRNVKLSTQTRLEYTSSSYDRSYDSWKRQLYSYTMEHGENEVYAQITPSPDYTEALFKELDVEVIETAAEHSDMKMLVKTTKRRLQLEYFASTRDGQDRTNHAALAQAMTQFLTAVLANQMMQQAIGPAQAISLMNQALEQFGFPRDFKLRALPVMQMDQQQQWVMEQLTALAEQIKQFVQQNILQNSQILLEEVRNALTPIQQATEQSLTQSKQALVESAKNTLAIAKISEVLMHHQDMQEHLDAATQPNTPSGAGYTENPNMVVTA